MNKWTQLVHFNTPSNEKKYGANSTPIYQTATFAQSTAVSGDAYDYSRSANPTRNALQQQLAQLEDAKFAFTYASGMAAITALTRLLKPGDHIIGGLDVYGGTYRLFTTLLSQFNIEVSWVDSTNLDEVNQAITPKTRFILVETPSNPLQHITPLAKLSKLAHQHHIKLVVDNSLMSPWLQRPLTLGADIVLHSATKHLGGHSDLTAGVIMVNNPELAKTFAYNQNAEGNALAPFESWLLLRGTQTLGLRIERQQENAMKLAEFLQQQPLIKALHYPGLKIHPGYRLHQQQAKGPGSLISFETGDIAVSKALVEALKLFTIAVSFGNLKSHISLPCNMSHASIPQHARTHLPADLVRISVGIESTDDLIADLKRGFAVAHKIAPAHHKTQVG